MRGGVQHFGENIPYIDVSFSRNVWVIGILFGNINGYGNLFVYIRHDGLDFKFYNVVDQDVSSLFSYSWVNDALRIYPPNGLTWYRATAITI